MANGFSVMTTDMHTGGEPLRILETGFPKIEGATLLDKRRYMKENLDHYRRLLMREPRGHFDMYGAVLVEPDHPEADIAVIFMHNEGYSVMCGHAMIALGRYAIDTHLVKAERVKVPTSQVNIQTPCGLVKVYVEFDGKKSIGPAYFHSVPCFALVLDQKIETEQFGSIVVDIGFGGTFYAYVSIGQLLSGLKGDSKTLAGFPTPQLIDAADHISKCVRKQVTLKHPESDELCFLYGTIIVDDTGVEQPLDSICVFADRQVDRCPTGSGVSGHLALLHRRGKLAVGQERVFRAVVIGSKFVGKILSETELPGTDGAIIAEVHGEAYYTSSCHFMLEKNDPFSDGFLVN